MMSPGAAGTILMYSYFSATSNQGVRTDVAGLLDSAERRHLRGYEPIVDPAHPCARGTARAIHANTETAALFLGVDPTFRVSGS